MTDKQTDLEFRDAQVDLLSAIAAEAIAELRRSRNWLDLLCPKPRPRRWWQFWRRRVSVEAPWRWLRWGGGDKIERRVRA